MWAASRRLSGPGGVLRASPFGTSSCLSSTPGLMLANRAPGMPKAGPRLWPCGVDVDRPLRATPQWALVADQNRDNGQSLDTSTSGRVRTSRLSPNGAFVTASFQRNRSKSMNSQTISAIPASGRSHMGGDYVAVRRSLVTTCHRLCHVHRRHKRHRAAHPGPAQIGACHRLL